jgi:hydrogenase expression/formation protein HypC
MCLAIPGKLLAITAQLDETFRTGKVSFGGIQKEVNLYMVPEAKVGDYVLVHVGVAINVVDEEEAKQTFQFLKDMGEVEELETPNNQL